VTQPKDTGASCPLPVGHSPVLSSKERSCRARAPTGKRSWRTAHGDIRYTLQTGGGALLYVQSRSVRHGTPEVLARLGRGENVDSSEYTFRASTQIETAALELDWLNKGVFIGVAGRQAAVIYETYLVG
jgi:Protein of unknown function (DUF3237)